MSAHVDFETVFGASPHAYLLLARDFAIVEVNQAYLEATGRDREDLVGQSLFTAFPAPPGDPEGSNIRRLRHSLERVLSEGKSDNLAVIHYPIPHPKHDGEVFQDRYWSTTNTPILGDDGEVQYILHAPVDITEVQTLKEELKENDATPGALDARERVEGTILRRARTAEKEKHTLDAELRSFRRLFDQAPGFTAILKGPDHVFTLANNAYYRLIGQRDVIGKTVAEALPEVEEQGFIQLLTDVYETGEPFIGRETPIDLQRKDGDGFEKAYLNFIYQPVIEEDGSTSGVFVQGHDVTDQKRMREKLEIYQEQLEELVRERTSELEESQAALRQAQKMEAIGNLTGGIAHDFNNLLHVIAGNLQFLQRDLGRQASTRIHKRLNTALNSVERGAHLASQLLAFGRRQALNPQVVQVGSLIREVQELLRRTLEDSVSIETVISSDAGRSNVDPHQLENALLNLAINARDAMNGQGRLTIEVRNAHLDESYAERNVEVIPGEYVLLAISDTGCGMPPEHVERAFEPFFSTKSENEGTGLGLSMVYGFVKQSEGHIKIYSEVGEGTTIKIYLPRTYQEAENLDDSSGGPVEYGDETLLVVEDDADVRATVVEMLRQLGYTVLQEVDGDSALAVIERGVEFDLLFTDVVMPGSIGAPELARRAREALPGVAVLFTTGYTEDAVVHSGKLDGGINLISKPYSQRELASQLRLLLDEKRASYYLTKATDENLVGADSNGSKPDTEKSELCILAVEDDSSIRLLIDETIKRTRHRVVSVATGEEALERFRGGVFDVLFADVSLPGIDGIELARRLLKQEPELKLVFASGHEDVLRDVCSESLQGAITMQKPYTTAQIENILAEITGD